MPPAGYEHLKRRVADMEGVTSKPMFGYQCFMVSGKFFVGFYNKNDFQVIVRLSPEQQKVATRHTAIKPFSRGAKMGWIELDARHTDTAMEWISKAYARQRVVDA